MLVLPLFEKGVVVNNKMSINVTISDRAIQPVVIYNK